MRTNVVVPIKDFGCAKQRLSGLLSERQRRWLARRLAERTLRFFARWFPWLHVLVVTPSAEVAELAGTLGVSVLREAGTDGLSAAVTQAAGWSIAHGFDSQLVIPADIGRLDADEIAALLRHPRPRPSVIVCAARDGGTNALLTTPPAAIPFAFGERSSEAHRKAAQRRGIPCTVLCFPHLSIDIDTTRDLSYLRGPARVVLVEPIAS